MRLMVQVVRVALRLLETAQDRIAKAGRARATTMFRNYSRPGGVLSWAPQMVEWLRDPRYLWYLGVLEVNP